MENKFVEGINKTQILEKLLGIQLKLKEITNAKTKLTNIKNTVDINTDSIKTILDNLKSDIENYIIEIELEFADSNELGDSTSINELVDKPNVALETFEEKGGDLPAPR